MRACMPPTLEHREYYPCVPHLFPCQEWACTSHLMGHRHTHQQPQGQGSLKGPLEAELTCPLFPLLINTVE